MRTRLVAVATAVCAILTSLLVGSVPSSAQTAMLPDLGIAKVTGVRLDETTMPGHKLLRYDSRIVNIGSGGFEVWGHRASRDDALMSVTQRIFDDEGGFTDVPAPGATMYWAVDGHEHWHVTDMEVGVLRRVGHRRVLGALAKHGFHMIDDEPFRLGLPGAPQTAFYDPFHTADSRNPRMLNIFMGLSVGWQDIYDASTNLQWIDVTGLRRGKYKMTVSVDPDGVFQETNDTNNWARVTIKLSRHSVTVLKTKTGIAA